MIDWQDEDGLPRTFEGETFRFTKDEPATFYQNMFKNCYLTLEEGAKPAFYACMLIDCTLEPPIIPGEGEGAWAGMLPYSVVQQLPKGGLTWSGARDARQANR